MEEININKPTITTGEPSAKETPKPTRAVEGSVGQDTAEATKADQQGTTGSGKATNPADPDAEMRRVATGITRLKLAKTRISGAQKRKMAIQAAIAAGEAIRPRRRRSNRGSKEPQADLMKSQQQTAKRSRSEGSTPSSSKSHPTKMHKPDSGKPAMVKPSTSGNQDTTGVSAAPTLIGARGEILICAPSPTQ